MTVDRDVMWNVLRLYGIGGRLAGSEVCMLAVMLVLG